MPGEMTPACVWFFCSFVSSLIAFIAISQLVFDHTTSKEHPNLHQLISTSTIWLIHSAALAYVYTAFRHRPHRRIGPFVRIAIHVTSILAAVSLGLYCKRDVRTCSSRPFQFSIALIMAIVDLHALAQLMHAAAGISLVDIGMGAQMQFMMVNVCAGDDIHVLIQGGVVCVATILYLYWSHLEGN